MELGSLNNLALLYESYFESQQITAPYPTQALLHTWEQEEVHRCQIQRIEQLLPGLDGDGGEPNSDYSSNVNSRFIPVENVALPSQPIGLFCLNLLKKILSSKCHDCKKNPSFSACAALSAMKITNLLFSFLPFLVFSNFFRIE